MAHCLPRSVSTILLGFIAAGACAAELGDVRVSSYAGQQLVADIELTALESPGTAVQVRLAHPDVYRGASIAFPPVLSSLNLAVMQRDGKQFLHVTSLKPVDGDHLHLYLELDDGGHRSVRLATVWLGADPHPAPPPAPVRDETAAPVAPPARVAADTPPAAPVRVPVPVLARPTPPRLPVHLVVVAPAPVAKVAAACVPQPNLEARACIVLDSKNAALRAQITQLEHKVKVMQGEMQGNIAAAPAAAQPAKLTPAPAGPAPILPHKRKKSVPPQPEAGRLPWLAIGIGSAVLMALAGAAAWVFVRRRRAAMQPAPSPAVMREGIKSRLMPGP
jgi:hypothetical protein